MYVSQYPVCKALLLSPLVFVGLFAITTSVAYTQISEKTLVSFCQDFDYQRLVDGLDSLKSLSSDRHSYSWAPFFNREVVNGFEEEMIVLVERRVLSGSDANQEYQIKLVKQDNALCFYEVSKMATVTVESVEYPTNTYVVFDSGLDGLSALHVAYKQTYNVDLNFAELFEQDVVYGWGCGYIPLPPKHRAIMMDAVGTRNIELLEEWLRSPVAEKQLYAIEGIVLLEKEGVVFDSDIYDLMAIIAAKSGSVVACQGCDGDSRSIADAIKDIRKGNNEQRW